MEINIGSRIQVININYNHKNRNQLISQKIVGFQGTIAKISSTENAFFVQMDTGHQVYLYDDEVKLIK